MSSLLGPVSVMTHIIGIVCLGMSMTPEQLTQQLPQQSTKILLKTYISNISSRSRSSPPPSSSSGPAKRTAADGAVDLPQMTGVDGAKAMAPENRRVMVVTTSFIAMVVDDEILDGFIIGVINAACCMDMEMHAWHEMACTTHNTWNEAPVALVPAILATRGRRTLTD